MKTQSDRQAPLRSLLHIGRFAVPGDPGPSSAGHRKNLANVTPQDNGEMVPSADDSQDPPSRVARLSYMDGSVSMQPGGAGDWGSAAKNRPVTIGDKLWTDKDSRAELQAGQASIHVGSMTALSLFLTSIRMSFRCASPKAHVNFRVRELRQGRKPTKSIRQTLHSLSANRALSVWT